MQSRVVGLGHVGIWVQDLAKMSAFYRDFMGMRLTKSNDNAAFFSSNPDASDHEIALLRGRRSLDGPRVIQQISLRVETLDHLRDFVRRISAAQYEIDGVVSHVSAIGCYFKDPEGNATEVFWLSGLESWVILAAPIDIERPDGDIMNELRVQWDQVRHVAVGETADAATLAAIAALSARKSPSPAPSAN